MAQNIKMGRIKGSKKQSKLVRKENLPYHGNRTRRSSTSFSAAFSSLPTSECSMANNSVSDDESTTSSWNLRASNIALFEEEAGIIPLPAEDEIDGHIPLAASQPMHVSASEPFVPTSSSGSVFTTLSGSNQHHVTPAVLRRDAPVADVPMAPRILGNSQRDNRPPNQHSSNHAASFLGILTPPRKDDLRPNHLFPKGPDHFEGVSEEVLLHIFSFLSRQTLARCMRVCSKWHRVANDESLWRRIDLAQKTVKARTVGKLVRLGTTHLRLARADIQGNKIKIGTHSLLERRRMCRLQYLDLSMASVSPSMLQDILFHCRQLRKVSLENVPINGSILSTLSGNRNLDTLNLSMCQGVCPAGLMALFGNCKMLTQLNLAWTGLSQISVSHLCSAIPVSIRFLNLSGCREAIRDDDVDVLCKRCTHLLELDLSDSLRLTDRTVEIIRWHLPELRHLSLSRCYSILPTSIGMLDALPSLEAVNVMGMLTEKPLEALQAMLPKMLLNKMPFSTVARPTTGQRRTSIWEQRVRENV